MDHGRLVRGALQVNEVAVELEDVRVVFGSNVALDGVTVRVRPRTIHALVGENGAGKTTLMRVLYGAQRPEKGAIKLNGDPIEFHDSAQAIAAGVGMVSQHYAIIGELSCLDNLILGAEGSAVIDRGKARQRAQELAERMGFDFQWDQLASSLSPAGAQKLEILKLLWRQARVMILDEPTAMLSPADSDALFTSLHSLAQGGATIIVVTHRLPEVLEHCQDVSVLRGGKFVAAKAVADTNSAELAELIVGRSVDMSPRDRNKGAEVLLEAQRLAVLGDRGNLAVKDASFEVRQGEIVGIAGVDGSGQRELMHCLLGVRAWSSGDLRWKGESLTGRGTKSRLAMGFRSIPEDRHHEAVIEEWSLVDNALLGFQRRTEFAKNGWLDRPKVVESAIDFATKFATKHDGVEKPIGGLSGGNQQRFVAGRAMGFEPELVLAFQPARGLDIAATQNVYEGMVEVCRRGGCALVVSFDLDELLQNCDRIIVMNRGKVFMPVPGRELNRSHIGELMVATT
ncbi:MAG TPA: ABC transporter ATP-binding protein [Fimbriimonadaceae bacterium]|nr:ABC transporter ATP-binding protein [Fimbriimonadaceae bacterium]